MSNILTNTKRVTISHIQATNVPAQLIALAGQPVSTRTNEYKIHQKHGKPIGAKDLIPWKKRRMKNFQVDT